MSSIGFHVLAKPIGLICNLDCKCCFYLEKEQLYPQVEKWAMREEVLDTYIRQYIEAHDTPVVSFAWQGGEPTLLGVDYFRNLVQIQKKYAGGKRIQNAFQTNGVLLNDAWAALFKENEFLIGLSIDRPRALHDTYRVDKGGQPTFDKVVRGMETLKRNGVEFNASPATANTPSIAFSPRPTASPASTTSAPATRCSSATWTPTCALWRRSWRPSAPQPT